MPDRDEVESMRRELEASPPSSGMLVAHTIGSLAALPVMLLWAAFAFFLFVLRCDESCDGDQADSWQYTGQAVVAFAGIALALVAIVLGYTRWRAAYWSALAVATGAGLVWWEWTTSGL